MSDYIKLLPDGVINQIAAGEVIQRPASVVKELMDNAIDSGASEIAVLVRDAGKTLIQVSDNGSGMSPTDARMAFERHATSKISSADDLFRILTKGFRGEALASIASVAQVEMRTMPHGLVTGTRIAISESRVKAQEPCACSVGTQIQVKNLFFNVPARRKFLKSDSIELRHIQDEFIGQALSFPEIAFSLQVNDQQVYKLAPSTLKQRIVGIFGRKYTEQLIPVKPQTEVVDVSGFCGKPEIARKSKGEQYLFVNRRAIRSPYLQHAVHAAYEQLLPPELHPFFVLFLNVDPEEIDINVHPTKNEIKFEDERIVYQFLKASVRYSLAQFTTTPIIDFEGHHPGIERVLSQGQALQVGKLPTTGNSMVRWDELAFSAGDPRQGTEQATEIPEALFGDREGEGTRKAFQYLNNYLVVPLHSGVSFIDQQSASERILYELYKRQKKGTDRSCQRLLFPVTLHMTRPDAAILREILPALQEAGFEIGEFGTESFILHGIPLRLSGTSGERQLVESILEHYKKNLEFELDPTDNLARSIASSSCIRKNQPLDPEEVEVMVEQLFLCEVPYASPSGKKCIFHFPLEELQKKFN
ncbi:MAG: DNA mismatch repair endonuclease MutL [Saprospiraceae bacterium]|nr:DNA mismatch repair endonuclease MutL [Saprospiraceae bacterium]